ncbi:MAG TPA: ABC transporter ATP-binding protein [Nitrolancea sp.]|nr:ABC transporter ATP-binding protein [Nitrolancea sp.]
MSREARAAAPTSVPAAPGPLLGISRLNVAYGDVQVLWDVSLEVLSGEIVALIGSNGAGKSTLLTTISGLLAPRSGAIVFAGAPITRAATQEIVRRGIAQVPEGRRLFGAMTVRDNLLMGAFQREDKEQVQDDLARVLDLFPRLKERLSAQASKLSGGEQQMVALGRGLMSRPRLLMIDELSLGLAPVIVENLLEIIRQINRDGVTVLIVEQDVQIALEIADRGYVLETGHITLAGPAAQLLADERVRQAYLGL